MHVSVILESMDKLFSLCHVLEEKTDSVFISYQHSELYSEGNSGDSRNVVQGHRRRGQEIP